jgi:hypothetical protein
MSVFIPCVGSGLAWAWPPLRAVLSTAYRIKKLKKRPRHNKRAVELLIMIVNNCNLK